MKVCCDVPEAAKIYLIALSARDRYQRPSNIDVDEL